MYYYPYNLPAGRVWIAATDDALIEISWAPVEGTERETALIARAARQLEEYFAGARTDFDLPLRLYGTPFRQRVWAALCEIPYGQTRTYGDVARSLGLPNTSRAVGGGLSGPSSDIPADGARFARAVGGACHNNPVSIVVPCHRVVGANGLTGYAGGLDRKKFLLEHEARIRSERTTNGE